MHPAKRIEIIADSVELPKIVKALGKAGVTNYSVIHNVTGRDDRGSLSGGLDVSLETDFVIVFCPPESVKVVVESIRPILNKFGGACYISEVLEIRSMRCVAALEEQG